MGEPVPHPLGLLAELTHRCPLGCPYCSNPIALELRADELDTLTWVRVFAEAVDLGVLERHRAGCSPPSGTPSCPSLQSRALLFDGTIHREVSSRR